MFKNLNKKDLFYGIIIVLILTFGTIFYVNNNNNKNEKFNNYEKTISALNDTIMHTKKDGFDLYSKHTPAININDLTNSEYFKTLTTTQKQFYTELQAMKGLISSTKAELEKQGQVIGTLDPTKYGAVINGDSVTFKKGTELPFTEIDNTKKLQWKAKVNINKDTKLTFDYDYKVNIQTNFVKQKDKSILVTYKIDDPELKLNNMMNFTIPTDGPKSKFGRWVQRNKVTLSSIGCGLIFSGGGYIGYSLGTGHFIGFN